MLYVYSKSSKKYTCEICADTPDDFMIDPRTDISDLDVDGTDKKYQKEERLNHLEDKLVGIYGILEKFNLVEMANELSSLGSKMEKNNNIMNENLAVLKRSIESTNTNREIIETVTSCSNCTSQSPDDPSELDVVKKDRDAYKASYELMMQTVGDRDKEIKTLRESKEKYSKDMDSKIK